MSLEGNQQLTKVSPWDKIWEVYLASPTRFCVAKNFISFLTSKKEDTVLKIHGKSINYASFLKSLEGEERCLV